MPRALWKGAIAFGLVHVPVELYPAEERKGFSFSMLDKRDFSPVGFRRYSKKSGKEVPWNDVVKGYEYEKGQYVVLSDEDFRRADATAAKTIDIETFVPASAIPPPYYETPYYLAPLKGGEKVYALLRETLKATGRVGVAQFVLRTTKHLAMVAPAGKVLVLNTLRYQDELRNLSGLDLPADGAKAAGLTARELDLAKKLIDDLAADWKPAEFRDTYHEDVMKRIREKIKRGQTHEITAPETEHAPARGAEVIDLAALLQKSLGRDGGAARKAGGKAARPRAAATKRAAAKVVRRRKVA
ncbi:MAG: Ku protein [Proteobacteria bacterium]|nr:Ku protein [Pseudomonadota bacterium]